MAKKNFPRHHIVNIEQNRVDQRQKSLNFRQAQFILGNDQGTFNVAESKWRSPSTKPNSGKKGQLYQNESKNRGQMSGHQSVKNDKAASNFSLG